MLARYEEGPEGHDLAPYAALFKLARDPPAAATSAASAAATAATSATAATD